MIQRFVEAWEKNKQLIRASFAEKRPEDYDDVVRIVVDGLRGGYAEWGFPDPKCTKVIEGEDYQGTNTYILGNTASDPKWYVRVDYGSCSGCDTLQAIDCGYGMKPTDSQIDEYMTLALHIVQSIREFE